ncbi:MAG: EamA family transporter [Chloroflexi bacterium]|jgi:multidrug transporter EmrE-like cation transporter|nr:MAG: 4-amino-4-deoxy-L-arabinose-phosphoundecaprenol flippase subunit ArnE [Chloroflexi bacterium OLB13]MBV6437539.1 4-amino-4-deoxy-L-arabinose-phosphoundecaprenol flippase subunit ArnE [Anaerolineae bacterium]MCC6564965.1 EamA family transporter [Chloroflexota bacterium]OQY82412.1 MAG: hypothetical protein B6D42_09455 [Anaerolineae bacterium UTCFX5]MBW7880320.1 EamA family transporter [Anaerolineae bacterium]
MEWVIIGFSTLFSILGQLGLKFAMRRVAASTGDTRPVVVRILFSPLTIGALFVYGCGVIFWLMALSRMDVSLVHPFASLSYIGIMVGSYYLFGEEISRVRVIGFAVVIFGVLLIGLSARL